MTTVTSRLDRFGYVFLATTIACAAAGPGIGARSAQGLDICNSALCRRAAGQIYLLRDPGRGAGPCVGILRDLVSRPWRVLRAWRIRNGHVSNAPDRSPRRLRKSDPAGFHGLSELEGASPSLVGVQFIRLRQRHDCACAWPAGLCFWMVCLSLARDRRLPFNHNAGDDICAKARVLSQRFRLWRQQRAYRFQGNFRFQCPSRRNPGRAVFRFCACLGPRIRCLKGDRQFKIWQGAYRYSRLREPSSISWISRSENYKLFAFVVSAIIAGVAGALYVPQVGIINPSEFDPGNSIEAVIWVAVGGRGTLVGAALGALVVNFAKTYFTGAFPEYWLFALGALFVLVTLFLPNGLLGLALTKRAPAPRRYAGNPLAAPQPPRARRYR